MKHLLRCRDILYVEKSGFTVITGFIQKISSGALVSCDMQQIKDYPYPPQFIKESVKQEKLSLETWQKSFGNGEYVRCTEICNCVLCLPSASPAVSYGKWSCYPTAAFRIKKNVIGQNYVK